MISGDGGSPNDVFDPATPPTTEYYTAVRKKSVTFEDETAANDAILAQVLHTLVTISKLGHKM